MRYIFREDEPVIIKAAKVADPQVIGEALDAIRVKAGGELDAEDVVKAAKEDAHPLHPHFEWNDTVAAHAFRVDQARNLIRIVRVEDDTTDEGSKRAFISINGRSGLSYRAVSDVENSADLQEALLAQAEKELEAFERRYRELKDICSIVRTAREKIVSRRRNKDETRVAA